VIPIKVDFTTDFYNTIVYVLNIQLTKINTRIIYTTFNKLANKGKTSKQNTLYFKLEYNQTVLKINSIENHVCHLQEQ